MRTTEKFNNLRNKEVRKHYSQFFSYHQLCGVSFIIVFLLLLKVARKRNALLPNDRITAIAEELAGFLLEEVIPEEGEHYYLHI